MKHITKQIQNQIQTITNLPTKWKDYAFADKLDQTITTITELDIDDYITESKFDVDAFSNQLRIIILQEAQRLNAALDELINLDSQIKKLQEIKEESNE